NLIFCTASETRGVGELVETLKWQQPAYVTVKPRSGSTIRIDAGKGDDGRCAIYFHCQTDLVARVRELYRGRFIFEGNRALHFQANDTLPETELRHCIALALTYHLKH